MVKGLVKFGKPSKCDSYDKDSFDLACKWMRMTFGPYVRNTRIWSVQECLDQLKLDTSAGVLFKKKWDSKADAIQDSTFWEIYRRYEIEMNLSGGVETIQGGCCKLELRPREKVEALKTRVFMNAPLHFVLFALQYCGDFNDKFYKTYQHHPSAVGMSKFNGEFSQIVERLKYPDHCLSLDGSNFDGSLHWDIFKTIAHFRFESYENIDPKILPILVNIYQQTCYSSVMMEDGVLVKKQCGNPSGSPNTIVDNTLTNFLLFAYAYIRLTGNKSYKMFKEQVSMNLFGDDNNLSLHPKLAAQFTPAQWCLAIKELGFDYTSSTDSYVSLYELDFLSHTLKTEQLFGIDTKVPVLELERLVSSLYWSPQSDPLVRLQRICSLRIEGYYTPKFREIVELVIGKYKKRYSSSSEMMTVLQLNYPTEYEIAVLYSGFESSVREKVEREFKFFSTSAGSPMYGSGLEYELLLSSIRGRFQNKDAQPKPPEKH